MTELQPSILLIEDDESLRRILARHLAARGYQVSEAASAEDAERLLARGTRPGLVLLDINLPGATGWDLLRGTALVQAGSPPVVVSSALTIHPRRLTEFGIAGYLPKPFPLETLIATVARCIRKDPLEP